MPSEDFEAATQIKDVISRLQSPIPDVSTLLRLLVAPLNCIGLVPPRFRKYDTEPLPKDSFNIARHIAPIQRALVEHVVPTWEPTLVEEDYYELVEQYFCPDLISFASSAAGQLAILAYSTLLSSALHEPAVRLLVKLCRGYPIDVLHSIIASSKGKLKEVTWEDCVRNVAALPVKVANAMGPSGKIPAELHLDTYFNNVSLRCERLMSTLANAPAKGDISSIIYLLTKLVNIGMFTTANFPSFFQTTLPTIRDRLSEEGSRYAVYWQNILSSFPSSLTLHSVLTALFASLSDIPDRLDVGSSTRAKVRREAMLLRELVGRPTKDTEILEAVYSIVLSREWNEGHARIFACWFCGAQKDHADTEVLDVILWKVVDMWTDVDHIKHSLLSRHRYVTALLLLILASFRVNVGTAAPFGKLAFHPPFVSGVSNYISHLDPTVRHCGMLVAEEVAHGAGKKLDFDDWIGDQHGRGWCRQIRALIQARDADVDRVSNEDGESARTHARNADEPTRLGAAPGMSGKVVIQDVGYDSDDSLTGYASPAPSSRSASPTPSELDEIEKDPSLNVGKKKVARPVYLAQLGEMVRSTSGMRSESEDIEAQKIEVALSVAEELIRRKRAFGTELDENAVNLTYGFLALKDNYDLEGFDEKRQATMNALVACCPRKVAPALIEQFFRNQYSANQRFVILNALGVGAAELASLPLPTPASIVNRFPSKQLPPALHKKYLTASDQRNSSSSDPIQLLVEDISRKAIDSGKEATADRVPGIVRERHLRIREPAKVTEVHRGSTPIQRLPGREAHPARTTFTEVAAECFICPLINRFWLFLRDEQTREERTMHQPALHRYRGAGTGLVLNALVLARFLSTLAVLVHAARNAPEGLAVIGPDALELAVTLGTRPVSAMEDEEEDEDGSKGQKSEPQERKGRGKEAAVLSAALELALIVLDGCMDLDGGRSLGLEHTALLLGAGEWAKEVFSRLDQGVRVRGEGGEQEVRLRRAAAGLVLKVDELSSRWRRSMVDVGSAW